MAENMTYARKLIISGKITEELEFGFSTEDGAPPHRLLLTHHVKFPTGNDPIRDDPIRRDYFIYLTREEMKKLRDTLNIVLDFTPEEPGNAKPRPVV